MNYSNLLNVLKSPKSQKIIIQLQGGKFNLARINMPQILKLEPHW